MTADCVERVLADGRAETARWDRLVRVEVICTPVATADGARLFAMLAESGPNDESPIGCLVPLGVGHDERLLDRLVRLPGFSVAVWQSSQGHRPPKRTVVWQRHPSASGDPSGDWDG